MSRHAPVLYKTAIRSSLHGLVGSLNAAMDASKGVLEMSEAEVTAKVPASISAKLAPKGPFADELTLIQEAVSSILAKYPSVADDLVLPPREAIRGALDFTGKVVRPDKSAPAKLKEKFGAEPRKVLAEETIEDTGEVLVVFEGGLKVSKANVVLAKAEKAPAQS
jgi:hypothetical protein